MRLPLLYLILLALPFPGRSQVTTSPTEGLRKNTPRLHVLRGADVWVRSDKKIANGVIVLRDGLIEKTGGPDLKLPANARVWDLNGKTVYAGFIESAASLGTPPEGNKNNTHWNSLIRPEHRAVEFKPAKNEEIEKLRKLGFTSAHILPEKGIFRGQSSLINLSTPSSIVSADVQQCLGFEQAKGNYPTSLMGVMALTRQTLYDARWYRDLSSYLIEHPEEERPEENRALAALETLINKKQSLLAETGDELDYARIFQLSKEFDLADINILGNGREYRQEDLLKKSGATVIVPLNFPKAPPVENPEATLELSLETLDHWERAPGNAASLSAKKIPICLTTHKLEKPSDTFWKQIREAINYGLSPQAALASLTETPASMLGTSKIMGSIEAGKMANLVVASGDLFTDKTAKVHAVWIDGRRTEMENARKIDFRGKWTLHLEDGKKNDPWMISGKMESPVLKSGEEEFPIKIEGEKILIYPPAAFFTKDEEGTARLTGHISVTDHIVRGMGYLPNGSSFSWSAEIEETNIASTDEDTEDEADDKKKTLTPFVNYPAGAFGIEKIPAQPSAVLVRNATIWTSGPKGRLKMADLLIKKGKIVSVGKNLSPPEEKNAVTIDAKGKHVTPGLIDCHSHSAISRGINEGSHAVTVEVRIADVVDPTDIALYRELAGGLTTSNILHGSANPMGGQNQVIKLRWGSRDASSLQFAGAKPGVKFALGENVKQSNWDKKTNRYPQTRMGVEQIMKDTFRAAEDYEKLRAEAKAKGTPHRRNLRLEAALEILKQQRIVHIHSYRQDEILMFVRLAQEFDITVGTFQHVLEGYKVADAIAEIGAGGSTFSDWWAYKFEVYDAIPYNGALMHQAGVVTSFNSDSNELATRLNTEAAKAVKYGGLSEEEALKFVTLNPAKQLRIDKKVGSLEAGKDADFVIWSGSPLSSFSRAEQTWIDGRRYFDLERDKQMRKQALSERERLISLALPKRIKAIKKEKKKLDDESDTEKGHDPNHPDHLLENLIVTDRGLYHDGRDVHSGNNCNACRSMNP